MKVERKEDANNVVLINCLMKESEEGSDSKIAVKVERKEDANNDVFDKVFNEGE